MNPTVTIRQLRERLNELLDDGLPSQSRLVLTTRENAGSLITLGVELDDGGIDVLDGVVFSGIEEI